VVSDSIQHAHPAGAAATLACLYEATARKPGNVHPGAGFDEATTYAAFVASAVVIGPILARAPVDGVGQTVLNAVNATRRVVETNTNLGTLLLLAPLAMVPTAQRLADGIGDVLERLTEHDARLAYEAIRSSGAGGLGHTAKADVFSDAPISISLCQAMSLSADRDLVARQYTNGFADVLAGTAHWIEDGLSHQLPLERAIIHAHVRQLAAWPDSLIQRKSGAAVAEEASHRSVAVLEAGSPGDASYQQALAELDEWLRADGNRRNPGTTADLVAAGLFVLLREGRLKWDVW
jgi:triphosphoribosyl-dephospho-CoA synthase